MFRSFDGEDYNGEYNGVVFVDISSIFGMLFLRNGAIRRGIVMGYTWNISFVAISNQFTTCSVFCRSSG